MKTLGTTPSIKKELLAFVRPSPHSKFSPSAAERWLACAYSIGATVGIPEEKSKYSEEGTLAHSVCEAMLRQEFLGLEFPQDLSMKMLLLEDLGQEMRECSLQYVDVITHWLNDNQQIGKVIHFWIEKGIPIFPDKGCFGTGDCIIVGTKGAAVIDFKYGKGKNVAPNSLQLKVYAAGLFRYMDNLPHDYKFYAVVHQPRTDMHAKEHCYTSAELNEFLGVIWEAITLSEKKDLEPNEGNHCFWCPAKRTKDRSLMCKVILDKPVKLAQENFASFIADMNHRPEKLGDSNDKRDAAIVKLRALYPLIKQVYEASEEEFKMRLGSGEVIPGVRLIEDFGNRTINAETDAEKARLIKEKFGVEAWKDVPATKKLRTITEIEKEIGKNKLDSVCVRKVTKKVDILDEKMRDILGEMSTYSQMIKLGNSQEDT